MRELAGMFRSFVILVTLGLLVVYAGSCGIQRAGSGFFSDERGMPLGWAGDNLECHQCLGGVLSYQSQYRYKCRSCGRLTDVKVVEGQNEYFPVR